MGRFGKQIMVVPKAMTAKEGKKINTMLVSIYCQDKQNSTFLMKYRGCGCGESIHLNIVEDSYYTFGISVSRLKTSYEKLGIYMHDVDSFGIT